MKTINLFIFEVFILLCMTFGSCKACQEVIEVRDSIRVEYKLDSVYYYSHDSIYVDRYTKGDTIFLTKELYKTVYKDKIVQKVDTVYNTQKVVQQVTTNKLNGIQKACLICGSCSFLILLLLIIIKIARK